jgi:putative hemolysin
MIYVIVLIPVLVLIIYVLVKMTQKVRDKVETAKVIQMSTYQSKKKAPTNTQVCSFCRKKQKKLAFYSDENGKVVGVCSVCKPQAERRALMRL